jgi:Archaeal putative transposase ISC1217.
MSKGKGQTDLARERLVREINRLGVVRRKGRSRKVGLALVLMILVGGRASVRNAAETFWLDYANLLEALGELHDAWGLEVLSGLVKGQVAVIIDDTVDHDAPGEGREPLRTNGSTVTPTGGSRGPSSSRSP